MRNLVPVLGRLEAEAAKLWAEMRRGRQGAIAEFAQLELAAFAAIISGCKFAQGLGWPLEAIMPKRHDVLISGYRIDRDWWYATKLVAVIVVSAAAAFTVIATLL